MLLSAISIYEKCIFSRTMNKKSIMIVSVNWQQDAREHSTVTHLFARVNEQLCSRVSTGVTTLIITLRLINGSGPNDNMPFTPYDARHINRKSLTFCQLSPRKTLVINAFISKAYITRIVPCTKMHQPSLNVKCATSRAFLCNRSWLASKNNYGIKALLTFAEGSCKPATITRRY